jgi:hypothetical protein
LFFPRCERSQRDSFFFEKTTLFFVEAQPVIVKKTNIKITNAYFIIPIDFDIIK